MKRLNPTKQRKNNKKVFGFDIETYNDNKSFYCASIYSDDLSKPYIKTFFDIPSLISEFKTKKYKNSYVVATNLSFDYFGILFNNEELKNFSWQFRGSDLIYAKSFIINKEFNKSSYVWKNCKRHKSKGSITFIDTGNYAKISVANLGKIIKCPKLKTPSFIGKYPSNDKEKEYMIKYNIRDSEISYKIIKFLFKTFISLGASPKMTIASTAMSLFRNKYLKNTYYQNDIDILFKLFKAYYGGRVEAFSRGKIENKYYYDFNSLYPSVMLNKFPDPNYMRKNNKNVTSYIESFEGVSHVLIHCPYMEYPLLPFRKYNKLIFPTGTFEGWYSNIELRQALRLGYVIKKVYENIYFTKTCYPFKEYALDLYEQRNIYKKQKSSMEFVVKILLNSLYGKFAQKFTDRDNWIHESQLTMKIIQRHETIERVGDYFRIKKDMASPSNFCVPIWALYVTAYGRLKLHDSMLLVKPDYVDTDSLITGKKLHTSNELGALKLELKIKRGYIVKPKFYAFVDSENNQIIKIKGIGRKLNYLEFENLINNDGSPIKIEYTKFTKFKEAVRRGLIPNEIQHIIKNLSLDDNKRIWDQSITFNSLNKSQPIICNQD